MTKESIMKISVKQLRKIIREVLEEAPVRIDPEHETWGNDRMRGRDTMRNAAAEKVRGNRRASAAGDATASATMSSTSKHAGASTGMQKYAQRGVAQGYNDNLAGSEGWLKKRAAGGVDELEEMDVLEADFLDKE